jgi:hypothetical protein
MTGDPLTSIEIAEMTMSAALLAHLEHDSAHGSLPLRKNRFQCSAFFR